MEWLDWQSAHAGKIGLNAEGPSGPSTKRPLAERRTPCLK